MEKGLLYKIDEYPDKLPNPRIFPLQHKTVAIKNHPEVFSDGFIIDLSVGKKDKQRLEGHISRETHEITYDILTGQANNAGVLLSEPRHIYRYWNMFEYIVYILFGDNERPAGIQVKYYHYFRNRYKKCHFYAHTDEGMLLPCAVKVDNKLVGIWMRFILPSNWRIQ